MTRVTDDSPCFVVDAPEAGNHAPRAGDQQRTRQAGETFAGYRFAEGDLAGTQGDQLGVQLPLVGDLPG